VNIYPVLLDSRPAYAGSAPAAGVAAAPASLLLMPLGEATLLSHVRSRLLPVTPHAPHVVAGPQIDSPAYRDALREAEPSLGSVFTSAEFRARLDAYDASDWLLVVDANCIPATGLAPESLLRHPGDPRWVRHLVALEKSDDGTRECVEFDAGGHVRRIRRFYDAVTWPFTAGVSCSLLPAACALLAADLPWTSLSEMKHVLSRHGIPSHDLSIQEPVVNLAVEEDMLAFSEHFIAEATDAAARGRSPAHVLYSGVGHQVDPSARLVGPVILQSGAAVAKDATILGPALIGRGARVGAGALVAQSVVAGGAVVLPGATVRHRVLVGETVAAEQAVVHAGPARLRTATSEYQLPRGRERRRDQERRQPEDRRQDWAYASWKPVLEGVLAGVALVLLSPLMLLLALVVKLDSRGPAFYGHKREGKDGRLFRCWKFRTMYVGADARERELRARSQVDGPQFKLQGDPRITRVGRWLRASNLDELPQLFNVLRREMSLVGPRPSPFQENQMCVPWREGRLSVRPGITGLWQVCRHERSEGDFHQWIQYDLLYVRHTSFAVDLKILAATVLTGGGRRHVPLSWILSASLLGDDLPALPAAIPATGSRTTH
jgi:lipopolysaccharide/colanic/teichoic acid biosynthesis glycosyltransferase